jgi:syntaxin 5
VSKQLHGSRHRSSSGGRNENDDENGAAAKGEGSDFYAASSSSHLEKQQQQQFGSSLDDDDFNNNNKGGGSSLHLANEAPKMKSVFHQRASRVGHAIHSTSQKLDRLAQLAKRSGAFDDSSQEINTISFAVKEDIKQLNTAIAELQQLALHEREQKTKQSTQHSETIVESLKGRLMDATKAFKDVLSERKESVKNNERRRSMFGGSGSSSLQTQQQQGGGFQGGTGRFASVSAAATTGSFMNVGARSSEQQQGEQQGNFGHMNPISFNQNQVAVYQDQDQNYATSRADAMQNVERTITELGGIFQQLATMVNEQGEMAIRIDENVEDVVMNVDQAQGELLKYLNYISNNRWLAMKVFGVLMAFLMFFIVFVA